jgi:hypothetical protein
MTNAEKICEECTNWEMYCSCDPELKSLRARVKELEAKNLSLAKQAVDAGTEASEAEALSDELGEALLDIGDWIVDCEPDINAKKMIPISFDIAISKWRKARGKDG